MPPTRHVLNPRDFTPNKVYLELAARLDLARAPGCTVAHFDRYSVGDDAGIASQVGRHARLRADDDDVQEYLNIPIDAFTSSVDVPAEGIIRLALRHIHPSIAADEDMGAVVRRGETFFARLETSSTRAQIYRPDGDDENGYTVFVLAVMNHLAGSLREMRWADDTRRVGRDTANWTRIVRRATELGLMLTFGTKTYNPQNEQLLVSLLGGMSQEDDVTRRKSMGGGRVEKLVSHGCPISERQLPHGVRHARRPDGRVLQDKILKFTAEQDKAMYPVIVEALRLHAADVSYVDIGRRVLVPRRVPRRGQSVPADATYADLADDPAALSAASKNFFVVSDRTGPGEEELQLAKLTLWETGSFPYRVDNDLRQRGVAVGGIVPTYSGPDDVTGHFDFLLEWDSAVTGFDSPEEAEQIFASCRRRLLKERKGPRTPAGRASAAGDRRAISAFARWAAEDKADQLWPGDTTEYGVTTRRHNAGRDTFVVVHFPSAAAIGTDGRPVGLVKFTSKPARHVAGTFRSDALCSSVSVQVQRAVEEQLLDLDAVAPVELRLHPDAAQAAAQADRENLERELEGARSRLAQAQREADGLRTAAGLKAVAEDQDGFKTYDRQAQEKDALAVEEQLTIDRITGLLESDSQLSSTGPAVAELDAVAYLQVGLARAGANNGRSGAVLGALVDRSFSQWRFRVRGRWVLWSCDLSVSLSDGRLVVLPLSGRVENIRLRAESASAKRAVVAHCVLHEGHDLDEAAAMHAVTRKTLLTQRLMPWLVERGVSSRGAKNALVDHPFPMVKRVLHAALTDVPDRSTESWGRAVRDLLFQTYTGDLAWGDAACPDDTSWIAVAVATVTQTTDIRKYDLPIQDLALQLGVGEDDVRELVNRRLGRTASGGPGTCSTRTRRRPG